MEFKHVLSFCVILTTLQCAQSLDYESAKEGLKCFEPPTVPSDVSWLMSVKKWYYLAMSRLDLYTFSSHMLRKDPKDIGEDEVYYESCLNWVANPAEMAFEAYGFHGKKQTYKMQPLDDSFAKTKFVGADGGMPCTTWTVLTDNKTYSLSVTCFHEIEQMIWTLGSPYKTLPKETIKLVHDHVESLGFKREYFTSQRYDYCDDEEKEVGKNEL